MTVALLVDVVATLLLSWLLLLALLWWKRPDDLTARELLRLLPDVARTVGRLARDPAVLGYLAVPVDLVPDVIPVIGYADDAVLVVLVLRAVLRRAGEDALRRHWPGTPEGLAAVLRVAAA